MHTGFPQNCRPISVNGRSFNLGDRISLDLSGSLRIETQYGEGAHIGFLSPSLAVRLDPPDLTGLV